MKTVSLIIATGMVLTMAGNIAGAQAPAPTEAQAEAHTQAQPPPPASVEASDPARATVADPPRRTVAEIREGSLVAVRLIDEIRLQHFRNGGLVRASLDEPALLSSGESLPRGADVTLTVSVAAQGPFGKHVTANLNLFSVESGGRTIPVRCRPVTLVVQPKRRSKVGTVVGSLGSGLKMAGQGAALGLTIGGPHGATQGAAVGFAVGAGAKIGGMLWGSDAKNERIASETRFVFVVDSPGAAAAAAGALVNQRL